MDFKFVAHRDFIPLILSNQSFTEKRGKKFEYSREGSILPGLIHEGNSS